MWLTSSDFNLQKHSKWSLSVHVHGVKNTMSFFLRSIRTAISSNSPLESETPVTSIIRLRSKSPERNRTADGKRLGYSCWRALCFLCTDLNHPSASIGGSTCDLFRLGVIFCPSLSIDQLLLDENHREVPSSERTHLLIEQLKCDLIIDQVHLHAPRDLRHRSPHPLN